MDSYKVDYKVGVKFSKKIQLTYFLRFLHGLFIVSSWLI